MTNQQPNSTDVRSSIRGTTLLLALFGKDVSYSKSPHMHNRWIQDEKLDAVYVPIAFPNEEQFTSAVIALSKSPLFLGGNITNPFKTCLLKVSNFTADARSAAIGACNTLFRRENSWHLTNTDIDGIFETLDHWPNLRSLNHPEFVVLGAGGAASAVVWSLRHLWPKAAIQVVCRNAARASPYLHTEGASVSLLEDSNREHALLFRGNAEDGRLLVNCLPLGNSGEPNPLAQQAIDSYLAPNPKHAYYFDLTYGNGPALQQAKDAGVPCQDGRLMLESQARASFAIWQDSLKHYR